MRPIVSYLGHGIDRIGDNTYSPVDDYFATEVCFLSLIFLPSPSTFVNKQRPDYSLMAPSQPNGAVVARSESPNSTITSQDLESKRIIDGNEDSRSNNGDSHGTFDRHNRPSPRLRLLQCTENQLSAIQKMLPDSTTIKWNTSCPDATFRRVLC